MKAANFVASSCKVLNVLITGPPGSGKGTISTRIVRDFGLEHFASGDFLRKHISLQTAVGLEAKKYINDGQLVPDSLMVNVVLDELKKTDKGLLLDGFPRTVHQAKSLQRKVPPDVVINLDVPFDVIINRVKDRWVHLPSGRVYNFRFNPPKVAGKDDVTGEKLVQRDDDKAETVLKRLEHHKKLTRSLLNYYREQNLLVEFAGEYTDEIWPEVHKCLASFSQPVMAARNL